MNQDFNCKVELRMSTKEYYVAHVPVTESTAGHIKRNAVIMPITMVYFDAQDDRTIGVTTGAIVIFSNMLSSSTVNPTHMDKIMRGRLSNDMHSFINTLTDIGFLRYDREYTAHLLYINSVKVRRSEAGRRTEIIRGLRDELKDWLIAANFCATGHILERLSTQDLHTYDIAATRSQADGPTPPYSYSIPYLRNGAPVSEPLHDNADDEEVFAAAGYSQLSPGVMIRTLVPYTSLKAKAQ